MSIKLEYFYDDKERIEEFDLFNGGLDNKDEDVIFYSNNELEMNDGYDGMCDDRMCDERMEDEEETGKIDEEFNNYFT